MEYPKYHVELMGDLYQGIDNTVLYNKYGFNMNKGIKIRKNQEKKKVEIILIVWNKEKSIYDNIINYYDNTLTYIGAGINSRQEIKRENQTLVNYFDKDWQIPVVLCSKIGKTIKYVSMLSQSKKGYEIPNETSNQIKFYFTMHNIDIKNSTELSNIIPNKNVPWRMKPKSKEKEKSKSIKRIISDQKLRQIMKEFQFVGDIGELVALDYEYSRLQSIGLQDYIKDVEHVSHTTGHGKGYDIESFDYINGKIERIYIEVKSTSLSRINEFYMSENEHQTMIDLGNKYRIYRVYDIYESCESVEIIINPVQTLDFSKQSKVQYVGKLK